MAHHPSQNTGGNLGRGTVGGGVGGVRGVQNTVPTGGGCPGQTIPVPGRPGFCYDPRTGTPPDPNDDGSGDGSNPGSGVGSHPNCGPGRHWDSTARTCVQDPPCPEGQFFYGEWNRCIDPAEANAPPADPPSGGGGGGGGGGGITTLYGGTGAAYAPSAADDALTRAITKLARLLAGQAKGLYDVGYPAYSQAVSYYSALLGRGGRAAAGQATAPAAEGIAQTYAGAARGLTSGYLRGGARDAALAELERSKAADISHLTQGVQPGAAAALAAAGLSGASAGMGGTEAAGGLYGGLLANQTQDKQFAATLTENQRQFNASLELQKQALEKMGGGGGGGGDTSLAEAALAEQKRQFDASLAFQQQQQKSQRSLAMGSTLGTLLGGLLGGVTTKSPGGVAAGAGVGGSIGGGVGGGSGGKSKGTHAGPNFPGTSPGSGTYYTG